MEEFTMKDLIEELSKLPQDAEVTYAELTAWSKDGKLISYDSDESRHVNK